MRFFKIPTPLFRLFPQLIWKDPNSPNKIFLTFDDGPDPAYTPAILDILQKHDARATFFVLGNRAQQHPGLVRQIHNNHAIGIHGFDHQRLIFRSSDYLFQQLSRSRQIVESIIDQPIRYFRPPYGIFSPKLIDVCRRLDLRLVLWSLMSYDFDEKVRDDTILTRIARHVTGGDIIVFHDGHVNSDRTVRILEVTIKIIKEKGFQLSSINK